MHNQKLVSGFCMCAMLAGVVLLSLAGPVQADPHRHDNHVTCNGLSWELERFDLDVDDDVVIITSPDRRHDRTVIEISGDYALLIDGEAIAVDENQKDLLKQFHTEAVELEKQAHEIAKEGARIGVKGAKLGLDALSKVLKLLSPEYDADDLEREVNREASKLEREAAELEKQAEAIEDMADDLDDQARELRRAIPELGAIRWF
jgi:hypothetical protein